VKKSITAFMSIFLLFGCVSTVYMAPILPRSEQIYSVKLGEVQESLLGDPMVSRINGISARGYIATSNYQPPSQDGGRLQFSPIATDSVWAVIGKLANGDSICRSDSSQVPKINSQREYCLVVNDADEAYGYTPCSRESVYPKSWDPKPHSFLKKVDRVYLKGSFKQELIYNGKFQNTIKLTYHEFKDDFARPAFNQELTYNLSEGKIIEFRAMKVEILEATNSGIKFIVKSSMN
jgi:hypothetical protein